MCSVASTAARRTYTPREIVILCVVLQVLQPEERRTYHFAHATRIADRRTQYNCIYNYIIEEINISIISSNTIHWQTITMHHYWMVQVVVEDDEIINYLYGSTIGFGACNMTVPTNERSHGRSLSNNVYINKYRRTNILCVTGKYCAWNRESNCSGCRDNISSRNVTLLSVGCLLLIVRSIFIVTKSWH